MVIVGIIGGSGLDETQIITNPRKEKVHTPYGPPSDVVTIGEVEGVKTLIIARHGQNHRINPSQVNYRANIWALKELGATHILAPTACGSLRHSIKPGHLVFIDQFIDRTTKRASTFYEGHSVCHIPMAEPFCTPTRDLLISIAKEKKYALHKKGTMITIEGPRFSTKAESTMFRTWGADVINMTTVPEVVLAREAGICYAAVAMSTDYDCWHTSKEPVSIEFILKTMKENAQNVKDLLLTAIPRLKDEACTCKEMYKHSLM